MPEVENRQLPIEISNAIKEAIALKLPEANIKRGSIYFYLTPDLSNLPIITIEGGSDKATHKPGGKSIHHPEKQWTIRATIDTSDVDDPEVELEQQLRAIRLALLW